MSEQLPPTIAGEAPIADVLAWSLRQHAGEDDVAPLVVTLSGAEGDQVLRLTDRLRVLPERRLVCAGLLVSQDRPIVVKWFFGTGANRYAERERRGIAAMRHAAAPTPELVASWNFGAEASALVFTQVVGAQELNDELLGQDSDLWVLLWQLLAQLNVAGVVHRDLHFGNVLLDTSRPDEPRLWLVDGDAVQRVAAGPVPLQTSVQAFSYLAAQAQKAMGADELQTHWRWYNQALKQSAGQVGLSALHASYNAARRARVTQFQAKTRRTCSAFALRRSVLGTALLDRDWLGDTQSSSEPERLRELLVWLDALPELFAGLDQPGRSEPAELLKAGNTATVVRASWQGRSLVIKRYNNKSWWHRMRRVVRTDRGLNSWVFAHTLRFVGIPTARAVALLRTRFGGSTYLVMEAIDGIELDAALLEGNEALCQRLVGLLAQLGAEGLVHNDTKASNFLWDADKDQLAVIDLDAMRMPARTSTQLSGQKRDRRRLLRNFAATPELQRRFRGSLGL